MTAQLGSLLYAVLRHPEKVVERFVGGGARWREAPRLVHRQGAEPISSVTFTHGENWHAQCAQTPPVLSVGCALR